MVKTSSNKPRSPKQIAHLERARAKLEEIKLNNPNGIKLGRPKSLRTLKREADNDAREKFLLFASANVLPISDALVQRAKKGDVFAIKEFFDRTWGKAPQTLDVKSEVKFSLIGLAQKRAMLDGNKDVTIIDDPMLPPETVN